jgi:hypothetical protein
MANLMNVKENRNYNGTENWNCNQIALNVRSQKYLFQKERLVALRYTTFAVRKVSILDLQEVASLLFLTS